LKRASSAHSSNLRFAPFSSLGGDLDMMIVLAFFFLGWRFGSIVQFFACLFAFLLLDWCFFDVFLKIWFGGVCVLGFCYIFVLA
jgi:hypothetical protein